MIYSPQVEARFRDPRWAGAPTSGHSCNGRATTPGSSAVLQISLQVQRETIQRASFLVYGCPSCIAAADWACEWLGGRGVADVGELTATLIESALELTPNKRHCGLLVEDAVVAALVGTNLHTEES